MRTNDFKSTVEFARKLHGHIGPYLVLGLKMGVAAKKALNIPDDQSVHLTAAVIVPLRPPTSCLLDGLQASTTCTIGNQRLHFRNSEHIRAYFSSYEGDKAVKITLTEKLDDLLAKKTELNELDEAFAWELAEQPESDLFNIALE